MSLDVLFTASNISRQWDLSLRTTKTVVVRLLNSCSFSHAMLRKDRYLITEVTAAKKGYYVGHVTLSQSTIARVKETFWSVITKYKIIQYTEDFTRQPKNMLCVVKTIFYQWALRECKILFLKLENKIHIFIWALWILFSRVKNSYKIHIFKTKNSHLQGTVLFSLYSRHKLTVCI